jgi:hypothetical protein
VVAVNPVIQNPMKTKPKNSIHRFAGLHQWRPFLFIPLPLLASIPRSPLVFTHLFPSSTPSDTRLYPYIRRMSTTEKKPTVLLVIGMAGSGKTTLMQRLNAHLHAEKRAPYVLNFDPAVANLPYTANIDIRDTVKYKEVMKQ